jgi:NADP-dependent aldehyde dehydrogenase
MSVQNVLIAGKWRNASYSATFQAENPATRERLADEYPVSTWEDCEAALQAAFAAADQLSRLPSERIAAFLEGFAGRIEARKDELAELANTETALPKAPRLGDVELPRTTNQLRCAADAAREGSWSLPTIDTQTNIRSCYGPIGPVCVFGPNNFPFAFNSIAGGDFAAAIAAGNPVIAKANSSHPGTTRLLAEEAARAADENEMPAGTVQLLYRLKHADGERLVADCRVGATGYTGSRAAGLALKSAADAAGKPIYLELSSINPVLVLPGALRERAETIADEFSTSCLMGTGQFCTNPGLVVLIDDAAASNFIDAISQRFKAAPAGTLLSRNVAENLGKSLGALQQAGAELIVGDQDSGGQGYSHANTLLRVDGQTFIENSAALQTEAFGNCALFVVACDISEAVRAVNQLEGNLTGCIYSAEDGSDDADYDRLAPVLRARVGRLLNDKMPTGVAVSPAMNHGGPFPATGHPGFTAVGIPASLFRFSMLQSYDNVRPHRLPSSLRDANPSGKTWRYIDGKWTVDSVS